MKFVVNICKLLGCVFFLMRLQNSFEVKLLDSWEASPCFLWKIHSLGTCSLATPSWVASPHGCPPATGRREPAGAFQRYLEPGQAALRVLAVLGPPCEPVWPHLS